MIRRLAKAAVGSIDEAVTSIKNGDTSPWEYVCTASIMAVWAVTAYVEYKIGYNTGVDNTIAFLKKLENADFMAFTLTDGRVVKTDADAIEWRDAVERSVNL